ncbi:MAG: peptide chain release factor 2, partial [Candidatus Gracilibacteria bacterium]
TVKLLLMQEIKQILHASTELILRGKAFVKEANLQEKIAQLESAMQTADFWENRAKAEKVSRDLAAAKKTVETWDNLGKEEADLLELAHLTAEDDTKAVEELRSAVKEFEEKLRLAETTLYLGGKFDSSTALLSIHVGAGGVDAADWAGMILRMYLRYAEKKNWKAEITEKSEAEEAGIKSATVKITGDYAYGLLKGEKGAHRLVRRSPFNSAHSRETSFAQVEVWPVIEDEGEIIIKPEEIRVETFCASGAGGQHVNRTESAVRIIHIPSGIVTSCQNERSQAQNKAAAMEMLRAKLAEKKAEEIEARDRELQGKPAKADFGGDAIRSYVLDDKRVKDKRSGYETHNPEKVLDGDLEDFIYAYLTKS